MPVGVAFSCNSLIQTGVDGVSNQPERILGMAAEGCIDNNQHGVLSATVFVKNNGFALCRAGLPSRPITGDEKIIPVDRCGFCRVAWHTGKPHRPEDLRIAIFPEAGGNAVGRVIINVQNGVGIPCILRVEVNQSGVLGKRRPTVQ